MKLRQMRLLRAAERFMPPIWAFAGPSYGRGFKRARRVALKLWTYAFYLRVKLLDV